MNGWDKVPAPIIISTNIQQSVKCNLVPEIVTKTFQYMAMGVPIHKQST